MKNLLKSKQKYGDAGFQMMTMRVGGKNTIGALVHKW